MKKRWLLIICTILPLSLYAADTSSFTNEQKDTEGHITKTLKPIVARLVRNHEEGARCDMISCHYPYPKYEEIRTPKDVYCVAKSECCKEAQIHRQRNENQYCECYAEELRKKSYDLKDINEKTFFALKEKMNNACGEYSDLATEVNQIYDKLFYTCKSKNSDVKFCDKLAQTVYDLIATEFFEQTSNGFFWLYESEYNTIITSKEFLSLFE